jgi:maltokinase
MTDGEVAATPEGWDDGVATLLPGYLGSQRWFGGEAEPDPATVAVESVRLLWQDGARRLWHAIVGVGDDHYQLLLGERPLGEPAEFLHGHEEGVLGSAGSSYFYDATHDADLARILLEVASGGAETAQWVRPVPAEQSNTSLVYDDRVILKVFRRVHAGSNPDVEVTTALYRAGFGHVAAPLVAWRQEPYDLAFGQQFLAGGVEGWALALTSLRDLYNAESEFPEEAGGDFAGEAGRLGRMTAEMHLALADLFGLEPPARLAPGWEALVDAIEVRLADASEAAGRDLAAAGAPLLARLRTVDDPGPACRVHGDYHLGQVMQTDDGWYVLDFEGEPARSLSERTLRASPLKDISGMMRSFDYAARFALNGRQTSEQAELVSRAEAWEARNRQAFLEGYHAVEGVERLLPGAESLPAVLLAYELDKALYELDYERAHRPEWVSLPMHAINRLLDGDTDS